MKDNLRASLDKFTEQGKTVAVVDGRPYFLQRTQEELKELGVNTTGFASISELESADPNIGAVVLGFQNLEESTLIEPAVMIAVQRRIPLTITTSSTTTPISISRAILRLSGVTPGRVPMDCVLGRDCDRIAESIAQGFFDLTEVLKQESSYVKFRLSAADLDIPNE